MAEVEIMIGGYRYKLSCGDGEEAALIALGEKVEEQVQAARGMTGGLTESRQLLFAALFLADQLQTAQATAAGASPNNDGTQAVDEAAIAARIDGLTSHIASLTTKLASLTA